MPLRLLINRAINWGFERAPNGLVYLQHRLARRSSREDWKRAPYYLIHIPKSGGQSVAQALSLSSPGHVRYRDLPSDLRAAVRDRPHVAVIRDPLHRLRSTFRYAHMIQKQSGTTKIASATRFSSLNEFIRGIDGAKVSSHYFFRPVVDFLADAPRERLYLIPFDRLQSGVDALHERLDLPAITLPRKNVTRDLDTFDLGVDAASEAKIRSIYAEDFRLYEAIRDRSLSLAEDLAMPSSQN